ncbi:replication initiation protein [Vibrio harveyi]|uniref:RepB family plasmid replication initiator protein n=1 Tax=Vibrio harveyi TaxID=669 RepID=UPI001EFE6F56|nr:replication initiation protein [Vibrio harveyi]MCG9608294.1 replication initiation protein [Vibrio harveyi]
MTDTAKLELDFDMINPPHEDGVKVLRLRNEFAFATFSLNTQTQRLLFISMSLFDINDFLSSSENYNLLNTNGKRDFSGLTDQDYRDFYWCKEYRTIILPMKMLLNYTKTSSRNYACFDKAIEELRTLTMDIDVPDYTGKRSKQNIKVMDYCGKAENNDVIMVFSQKFIPYVLSLRGYTSLDLATLISFKNKYSLRYYHWFSLRIGSKPSASFEINISELRNRFELDELACTRHFWQRIVIKSINEVNEKSDLEVDAKAIKNRYKKGKPIEKVKFFINRKISESNYEFALGEEYDCLPEF